MNYQVQQQLELLKNRKIQSYVPDQPIEVVKFITYDEAKSLEGKFDPRHEFQGPSFWSDIGIWWYWPQGWFSGPALGQLKTVINGWNWELIGDIDVRGTLEISNHLQHGVTKTTRERFAASGELNIPQLNAKLDAEYSRELEVSEHTTQGYGIVDTINDTGRFRIFQLCADIDVYLGGEGMTAFRNNNGKEWFRINQLKGWYPLFNQKIKLQDYPTTTPETIHIIRPGKPENRPLQLSPLEQNIIQAFGNNYHGMLQYYDINGDQALDRWELINGLMRGGIDYATSVNTTNKVFEILDRDNNGLIMIQDIYQYRQTA